MNLPNKLTVTRMALVPVIAVLLLAFDQEAVRYIGGALFIIAALTDLADGIIARKRGLVTVFGQFMDPLADKMLICATLVSLVAIGKAPAWALIVILTREFAVSGLRMVAAQKSIVIAASKLGKIKTNLQVFWLASIIFDFNAPLLNILEVTLMWLAMGFTLVSFAEYLWKNRQILKEG